MKKLVKCPPTTYCSFACFKMSLSVYVWWYEGGGVFSSTTQHSVGTCIKPYLPIVSTVQGNPLSVMSSWISH